MVVQWLKLAEVHSVKQRKESLKAEFLLYDKEPQNISGSQQWTFIASPS